MEAVGVTILILLYFGFFIGTFGLWIWMLVEVARLPEHAFRLTGREKTNWILVVALAQVIGAIIWWFAARKEVRAAAAANPYLPPAVYGPPPGWYPDPTGSGGQRWWDGARWAGDPPP